MYIASILIYISMCCFFLFYFTDVGRVYKVVQWVKPDGEHQSILLDVFDVTPGEPIRLMEISRQVSADVEKFQFNFHTFLFLLSCSLCEHDGWLKLEFSLCCSTNHYMLHLTIAFVRLIW